MSIRYLEFDSRFRDRTLYPNPSTFVVEASQTGQGDRFSAKDPVCDSSPISVWNTSLLNRILWLKLVLVLLSKRHKEETPPIKC